MAKHLQTRSQQACSIVILANNNTICCQGTWTLPYLAQLEQQIASIVWPNAAQITLDGSAIVTMDTAGAWLLYKILNRLQQQSKTSLQQFKTEHEALLTLVQTHADAKHPQIKTATPSILFQVGQFTVNVFKHGIDFFAFIGELFLQGIQLFKHPRHIRWRYICGTLASAGYQALPIIALLTFLIGVVLAYQMGLQLKTYGANIYIVDLLGLSILREFAPLITAIIVAGRTGSAFAAQIGTMKVNEEIDALRTMGIPPTELLILPKIIGLSLALPLLTVWADIFGVIGGMLMSKNILHLGYYHFLKRFAEIISVRHFILGLIKAPVFAMLIASIGCFQGLQVSGSAESVGRQTTKSVVQAIFFIIIADAIFSIVFSWLKI